MNPLATTFTRQGFAFAQLRRTGSWAMYRKTKESAGGLIESFEVVRIRTRRQHQIDGRLIKGGEFYPSPEEWGAHAFSYCSETEALKGLREHSQRAAKAECIGLEMACDTRSDSRPHQTAKKAVSA